MFNIIEPKDHRVHQARINSLLTFLKMTLSECYQNFSLPLEKLSKSSFMIASDNERGVYGGTLFCKKKVGVLDEKIGNIITDFQSNKQKILTITLCLCLEEEEVLSSLEKLEFFQNFLRSLFKKLIKLGKKEKSTMLVLFLRSIDFFKTKIYGHWPYLLEVHTKNSIGTFVQGIVDLNTQKLKAYQKPEASPKPCGPVNSLSQVRRDAL